MDLAKIKSLENPTHTSQPGLTLSSRGSYFLFAPVLKIATRGTGSNVQSITQKATTSTCMAGACL